ncbi:MAG: hypothetical protein HY822_19395 [Acidobacteria bacterium]|nr:hypothetical protein [Acidobacteriota bacterium]
MPYFPQLSTGNLAQYPVVRRRRMRSVVNESPGGGRLAWADANAESTEWELALRGLTAAEWGAIESLFESRGGRLNSFVFLDPVDNLLGWSEELSADIWTADPMLAIEAGRADPVGTQRGSRLVNTGQAAQRLTQALAAPAWFQYCLSAQVRSESRSPVRLVLRSAQSESSSVFEAGADWRPVWFAAKPGSTAEAVACGVELAPGASVEVFGLQLEAQGGPGAYSSTPAQGGVYPACRFGDDVLRCTAEGADQYAVTVRITSCREGV